MPALRAAAGFFLPFTIFFLVASSVFVYAAEEKCDAASKTGDGTVTNDCKVCVTTVTGEKKWVGASCTVTGGGDKTSANCTANHGVAPGTCATKYCVGTKCFNADIHPDGENINKPGLVDALGLKDVDTLERLQGAMKTTPAMRASGVTEVKPDPTAGLDSAFDQSPSLEKVPADTASAGDGTGAADPADSRPPLFKAAETSAQMPEDLKFSDPQFKSFDPQDSRQLEDAPPGTVVQKGEGLLGEQPLGSDTFGQPSDLSGLGSCTGLWNCTVHALQEGFQGLMLGTQPQQIGIGEDGKINLVDYYNTAREKFANSDLIGRAEDLNLPERVKRELFPNGGTSNEWARFATQLCLQESSCRVGPVNSDGSLRKFSSTPAGERSYGPLQFNKGEYGLETWADVNNPERTIDALINVAEANNLQAYFGSISRPNEVLQHSSFFQSSVAPQIAQSSAPTWNGSIANSPSYIVATAADWGNVSVAPPTSVASAPSSAPLSGGAPPVLQSRNTAAQNSGDTGANISKPVYSPILISRPAGPDPSLTTTNGVPNILRGPDYSRIAFVQPENTQLFSGVAGPPPASSAGSPSPTTKINVAQSGGVGNPPTTPTGGAITEASQKAPAREGSAAILDAGQRRESTSKNLDVIDGQVYEQHASPPPLGGEPSAPSIGERVAQAVKQTWEDVWGTPTREVSPTAPTGGAITGEMQEKTRVPSGQTLAGLSVPHVPENAQSPYGLWGTELPSVDERRGLYDQLAKEGLVPQVSRYTGTEKQNWDLVQGLRAREQQAASSGNPYAAAASYKGDSVVDFLDAAGRPSDATSRAALAAQYGIENYDRSASKNLDLLDKLRAQANTPPLPVQKPVSAVSQPETTGAGASGRPQVNAVPGGGRTANTPAPSGGAITTAMQEATRDRSSAPTGAAQPKTTGVVDSALPPTSLQGAIPPTPLPKPKLTVVPKPPTPPNALVQQAAPAAPKPVSPEAAALAIVNQMSKKNLTERRFRSLRAQAVVQAQRLAEKYPADLYAVAAPGYIARLSREDITPAGIRKIRNIINNLGKH